MCRNPWGLGNLGKKSKQPCLEKAPLSGSCSKKVGALREAQAAALGGSGSTAQADIVKPACAKPFVNCNGELK